MMLQNHHQDTLNQWVGRLNTSNIPVFSRTVQQILKLTTSTSSSAAQLAYTILEDASLTARILRAAKGAPRKRLVEEMARSFHAATQAKAFATRQRDPDATLRRPGITKASATHIPRKDLIQQIHAQARKAASIISSYGASHISELIPQP